ncbi:MAG TPA: dihydroorotate dehydrogenase [Firmicutes bacterium]|nr:dihydroorotate dehydrogenase [Bacillota bacterium]
MIDMSVSVCGVRFKNPIIAASGTYGFGTEYEPLYPLSVLGGVSLKGMTLLPREGNDGIRIAETPMGMLNCVGLQNPGVEYFIEHYLPLIKDSDCVLIANIAGNTIQEYCAMADRLAETAVDMLEMNISCPNVKKGGVQFGTRPELVKEITAEVKKHARQPLIVKLSPNVTDIKETALAAQEGGADCISLINTITGMSINAKTRRPLLGNIVGGLSGPCVKPVALRMVYECSKTVQIPIIGMGGINSGEDAAEFMLAGAAAVMVGTANIADPLACPRIIKELENFGEQNGLEKISELTGGLIV